MIRRHFENLSSEEIEVRLRELALYSSTKIPEARRDPIFTPIFTAILGAGGLGLSGAALSIGVGLASAIATTALTIGLQMIMAPKPPKAEAAKIPLTQPIPYRIWGVGRTRLAGAYMLWETAGPNLYAVQAIAGHRIKSFNRFWLHDDEVFRSGDSAVYHPGGRYGQNVFIGLRLGLPVESPFGFYATGIWTPNHRGDGQAQLGMVASATRQKDQNSMFPYGPPSLSTEADLALCWDFRDPDQDPDDPETWEWTQNSAIICAWHLCFNEFGYRLDYHSALLPVIDLWKEEADICDENVPRASGGFEKRYQCNGHDTTENAPKSGLNAILASCDGHLVGRGDGARILTVGKFRESRCGVLTDEDITGRHIQYDVLFEDEVNRLVPKFTYPDTDYTTTDTDYFEDTDAQVEAGRILSEEANYQWVHQWRQARRLGKRDWLRLREKVKGSIDIRLSGINVAYSRWVRIEAPNQLPRLTGKIVENRRSVLALTRGGFTMDIVKSPDDIDVWVPEVDEGHAPPVPLAPTPAAIPTPVINLLQAQSNAGTVYIRVVIINPADASLTPVVRYRVADIGGGIPGAWVEQSYPDAVAVSGFINLNTGTVPVDTTLQVGVAFIGAGGGYSAFSPTEDIVSTADPTPPAVVTGVSVTPGSGTATFNWTAPNSANYAGAKIYWNTVNTFGTAAYIGPPKYGAPSSVNSIAKALTAGVRYGWVVPINGSGVEGTPTATGSFTVT
ncbi:Hypothetical protein RG1141_CH01790 [Neorhizobium galegae bv. officinalis bv. officinalis str. HAMBI 1141]|uniref:Tip attachment protein J domain-containing protein n=1 Tax=Neorhizobium galegae bv. officinalis bv. officinalis str. HAMBI 1141 TaxID=1028801 RepID=A0A068T363_NEOGA|nr:hypothetical protein [Neorhizobium galegae]CDN52544.1 Hypothetical protein RG1141_CH01790 [Neorhizobium galegae bv. officinalis bv. officinalis str. HAMBI 1141]